MTTMIIKDSKKFRAHLTTTGKAAGKLRVAIDVALRSALYHVWKYGDSTVMDALNKFIVDTVTTVHANAAHKWLAEFGKEVLLWDAKGEAFKARAQVVRSLIKEDALVKHLEEAKPYYSFTPPQKFQPFNVVAVLNGILKKADRLKEQHDNGEVSDEDFAKHDFTGLATVQRMLKNIAKTDAPEHSAENDADDEATEEAAHAKPKRKPRRTRKAPASSAATNNEVVELVTPA